MNSKEIIRKTLTILVFVCTMAFISCSDKLYTGSTSPDDEDWEKSKTKKSIIQDQSVPSPYTDKYKAKLMDKYYKQ